MMWKQTCLDTWKVRTCGSSCVEEQEVWGHLGGLDSFRYHLCFSCRVKANNKLGGPARVGGCCRQDGQGCADWLGAEL